MKILLISIFIFTLVFLPSSKLDGQESHPFLVSKDLEYYADGKTLLYDRYYDTSQVVQPLVVILHGGAFQKVFGEKEYMQLIATDIAEAGYQVFNINYLQDDIYITADDAYWQSDMH